MNLAIHLNVKKTMFAALVVVVVVLLGFRFVLGKKQMQSIESRPIPSELILDQSIEHALYYPDPVELNPGDRI